MFGDAQAIQPVRGINSPSESRNPLKRIDENIEAISNRFQPVRGMNSPSESRNPPKRIDENIEAISNRFQPISAISPEIDFRVGGDVKAIQPVRGINSPSETRNPLKRIDENIQGISNRFQPISAISPEIDFRVGGDVLVQFWCGLD